VNKEDSLLLVRGGHIIAPGQDIDRVGDILIAEDRILQAGEVIIASPDASAVLSKARVLDVSGLYVCPGLVDIHCHLREPGFEDKETVATGTKAASLGGFTTVCCMANTEPPLDTPASISWLNERVATQALIAVLPMGCITRNRKGRQLTDMAALAKAGVIGFSDDGSPVASSWLMRRAMEQARHLGLPIIDHCEDRALSKNGIINEGQVSARLRLQGIPAAAEEIIVARDLILAGLTGARLHICHVSTRGSVELIRRGKEGGISVTAEVTPHHLTLTEEGIVGRSPDGQPDANAKVNPPLRAQEDVEALIKGLKDGVIDAIATDHAPHTAADKNRGLKLAAFGISGFETAFGCLMGLVHRGDISLTQLISKLTTGPAKVIARGGKLGTLTMGATASVTIFDIDHEWIVDSRELASKGKNTPYQGHKFRGKVMATIANGRIVHMDPWLLTRMAPSPSHRNLNSRHPEPNSRHSQEPNG
jgi:dihydroorotase